MYKVLFFFTLLTILLKEHKNVPAVSGGFVTMIIIMYTKKKIS